MTEAFDHRVPDPAQGDHGAGSEGADRAPEVAPPVVFRPLSFEEVTLELPARYPTVVLQELDPPHRQLHIPVGMAEGNAIAYAARQIPTSRPLTHELMSSVLRAFGLEVVCLRITEYRERTFIGEIVISGHSAQRAISCRVSDGVALCLRQQPYVPITASVAVMDTVGISV